MNWLWMVQMVIQDLYGDPGNTPVAPSSLIRDCALLLNAET